MYRGHFSDYPPVGDVHTHFLLSQLLQLLSSSYFFKQVKSPEGAPRQKPDPRQVGYLDYAFWLRDTALDIEQPWTAEDEEQWHISKIVSMLGGRKDGNQS